jgi:integrase
MKRELDDFEMQIERVSVYMAQKLMYSESYIDRYKYGWRRIKFYLSIHNYKRYEVDFEEDICKYIFKNKNIRKWNDNEQLIYRSIRQLSEFVTTGHITTKHGSVPKHFEFEGDIGRIIKEFSDSRNESFRTGRGYVYSMANLHLFYKYCEEKGINKFNDIDLPFVLKYISKLQGNEYANLRIAIPRLRQLLKYAFETKILSKDISEKIPFHRSINNRPLPSVYSADEINILLKSINRNTNVGKRNYAILLLATHLGIRASDITNLKFENIDWEKSIINFVQIKTQKPNNLPLLSDVGNAIIDYMRNGRPISKEPYIFLSCKHPFTHFNHTAVSHIVQRAFKRTGIDISSRKFGAHSLRHSLASRMLERKVIYPVISEVLGHENSNSTMVYLNIDLKSLAICLTDVPPIAKDFYEQEGGIFYA